MSNDAFAKSILSAIGIDAASRAIVSVKVEHSWKACHPTKVTITEYVVADDGYAPVEPIEETFVLVDADEWKEVQSYVHTGLEEESR